MDLYTSYRVLVKMAHLPRVYLVYICLCFLCFHSAQAGCFTTTDTLGCIPYTVSVQECTGGDNSIQYDWNAEDGSPDYGFNTSFTYTKPGRYKIHQRTQSHGSKLLDGYIVVIDGKAPEFKVRLCENRTIALEMTDSQFQVYAVDYGDGSPIVETGPNSSLIHTYPNTNSYNVKVTGRFLSGGCPTPATQSVTPVNSLAFDKFFKVVNTHDKPNSFDFFIHTNENLRYEFKDEAGALAKSYQESGGPQSFVLENVQGACYEYTAKTACGETFVSSKLCLGSLTHVLSDTSVIMSWSPNDPALVSHYEVRRDGSLLARLSAIHEEFNDYTVKCGKNYCYEVTTKLKDSTSYIVQRCLTAASNRIPDKPYNVVSTFSEDNQLTVRWEIPSNSSFKSAHLKSQSSNRNVYEARGTTYTSKTYDESCYTLIYLDSCDKVSEEVSDICPIMMKVNPEGQGLYAIQWNHYAPVSGAMLYELYEEGKLVYAGASNSFKTLEKDTVQQIKTFHIVGISPDGLQVRSNTVKLEQEMKVYFPTAFSPNDDGLNDTFAPKTRFVKSLKMAIYNIWGELVYTANDKAMVWKAENYSNGVYQYIAEAEDFLGNRKEFRGQVTIVK